MKKLFFAIFVAALLLISACAGHDLPLENTLTHEEPKNIEITGEVSLPEQPERQPELSVSLNLQEPPEVELTVGDETYLLSRGTYSWNCKDESGGMIGICADSVHPLDAVDNITEITDEPLAAEIKCAYEYSQISVRCWDYGQYTASAEYPESETIQVTGNSFQLKEGVYAYELHMYFDLGDSYGDACYMFFAQTGDLMICF